MNALSHGLHLYGFSPLCVLWWSKRLILTEKAWSHWLNWYGFSSVCVVWWHMLNFYMRKPCHNDCIGMVSPQCVISDVLQDYYFFVKALSHWLHVYGFSPVCVLWWSITLLFNEKVLPYWLHRCGFSTVCPKVIKKLLYFTRSLLCEKVLSYSMHWYGFSPLCVLWCFTR